MAKKKKGGGGHPVGGKKKKSKESGLHWTIAAISTVIFAVVLFVSLGLPMWRVSEPTTVHYIGGAYSFKPTYYGLFIIRYNGGAKTTTWDRLTNLVCSANDLMFPVFIGQEAIGIDAVCPGTCRSHYSVRCETYRKITSLNYVMIIFIIIGGCLSLAGSGWVFIFGPNRLYCMLLWCIGGFLPGVLTMFWCIYSDQRFSRMLVDSNFPYPSLGAAVWLSTFSCSGMLLCGTLSGAAAWYQDHLEWKQKQAEIDQLIINEPGGPMAPFPAPGQPPGAFGVAFAAGAGGAAGVAAHGGAYGAPPPGYRPPPPGYGAPMGRPLPPQQQAGAYPQWGATPQRPPAFPPMGGPPMGGRPPQGQPMGLPKPAYR